MRRASKIDANQPEIVEYIRSIGGLVLHLHTLKNCCDLLVGFKGEIHLFEVKTDDRKKLTPGEAQFFEDWMGYSLHIITGIEDVKRILKP